MNVYQILIFIHVGKNDKIFFSLFFFFYIVFDLYSTYHLFFWLEHTWWDQRFMVRGEVLIPFQIQKKTLSILFVWGLFLSSFFLIQDSLLKNDGTYEIYYYYSIWYYCFIYVYRITIISYEYWITNVSTFVQLWININCTYHLTVCSKMKLSFFLIIFKFSNSSQKKRHLNNFEYTYASE